MKNNSHGNVIIQNLRLRQFRNLSEISFEPAPRLNLIFGDNGHGKTSLIEALYILATTQSFRSSKLGETIQDGKESAQIKGLVQSFGLTRELKATVSARGRSFLLDGKSPKRRLDYALQTPVIAFHPGDLLLVNGPASHRRTLLDRVMIYQDPTGSDARIFYKKALRDRQKILAERGIRARELDAYEEVIARYGARYCQGRSRAAQTIVEALGPTFQRMADPHLQCVTVYEPGGVQEEAVFLKELQTRRQKDLMRGAATFGPQKDEIFMELDGRPARSHGSQGQQRLLTLAMKLAELHCVREITHMEPMLLLDDVSSELDPLRTAAVFEFLKEAKSQIFVTTTRRELFSEVRHQEGLRKDFEVREGALINSK